MANNLPVQPTSFVGREAELAELPALVAGTRLVTLTGPGGAGKSRLALEVAGAVAGSFEGGVWLVELAALTDRALVPNQVARALGVRENAGSAVSESITARLSGPPALVLLDNCEHLTAACGELADSLLHDCPALRLLATSREPLGVSGEMVRRVPSLPTPGAGSIDRLDGFAAVQLFMERARRARPGFALTPDNAQAVATITRRLDGIPLAIELAASRVKVLSAEQIAHRLDDRFRLLRTRGTGVPPRQQALRASVEWSYDLLSPEEQRLFRRLSVFAGRCALDAAEAVCGGDGIEASDVLDLIDRIVDRSLVAVEHAGGEARYVLLETLRAFAAEKLAEQREDAAVRAKHLGWYLALAESTTNAQAAGSDRFDSELDNFRAALAWGLSAGRAEDVLRLAVALEVFWRVRGHWQEGRRWLDEAIEAGTDAPAGLRARALSAAGVLAVRQADYGRAREYHEEALALARAAGDTGGIASSLRSLGVVAFNWGHHAAARSFFEESLALYRDLDDRAGVAAVLQPLGAVAWSEADFGRARALYRESAALAKELGNAELETYCLFNLGLAERDLGNLAAAQDTWQDCLRLARELRNPAMQGRAFVQLAALAEHSGDRADARRALDDATRIADGHGDRKLRAECLHWLGRLEAGDGELDAAEAHQRESLRLLRDMGDRKGIATCEWALGLIARGRGNTVEAQRAFEDALRLGREVGDPLMTASALCELGDLALDAGDHAAARDLLDESLALRREAGAALGVADTLVTLGRLAAATGDRDVARERFDEAASLAKVAGSRKVLAAAQAELGKLDIRGTPQDGAVFRREGEYWTVSFRDTTLRLKDSRGLRYLALLLAHPGREFHVLDVHALVEGVVATTDDAARVELKAGVRSGGEILDAQARRAYLARLEEVRAEVEEAEAWGDLERGARSREELDALLRQLAGGVGLGGRERKEVSDADRARWAVGKAIRRSLERIAEDHPALGDHLRASIKTGAFCSYDPDAPVAWSL